MVASVCVWKNCVPGSRAGNRKSSTAVYEIYHTLHGPIIQPQARGGTTGSRGGKARPLGLAAAAPSVVLGCGRHWWCQRWQRCQHDDGRRGRDAEYARLPLRACNRATKLVCCFEGAKAAGSLRAEP